MDKFTKLMYTTLFPTKKYFNYNELLTIVDCPNFINILKSGYSLVPLKLQDGRSSIKEALASLSYLILSKLKEYIDYKNL